MRGDSAFLPFFRDAAWINGNRAASFCRVFGAITAVAAIVWIVLSHNGIDPTGKPLGTDFLSFWTASKLALSGHPADAYVPAIHFAEQRKLFPGFGYEAFFYPPMYLLLCLPLTLFPYFVSLALWLAATGYAYGRVIRAWLGEGGDALWIAIFAFPAVASNVGHGQNAFLTTALLGGGLLALWSSSVLAGICFGALIFKPHLGVLIPVLLIASGRWTAILAAGCTAIAFAAVSLVVFGVGTWQEFFHNLPFARDALENGIVDHAKMVSVFAGLRLLHASVTTAYAVQFVSALIATTLLTQLVRRRPSNGAHGPALVLATLLTSPFLLDYDLTLLAIPLAWTFAEARRTGFLPWEKLALIAGFALPGASRWAAMHFGVPISPPIVLGLLLIVIRRGRGPSSLRHAGANRTINDCIVRTEGQSDVGAPQPQVFWTL